MKRSIVTWVAAGTIFLILVFATGLLIGTAALASPNSESGTSEADSSKLKVSDAGLTWGINAESGAGAYLPGSCNFLSAGVAADNGGSSLWPNDAEKRGLFKAQDGNVKILRPTADGGTQPITWDNKCQTPDGKRVNTAGVSSGNYVQFSGGTGEVDTATNTGNIQWEGSFTVVYYSGYTYWSVSNPKLEVKNGKGKITGTFSGYGADMADLSKWEKLKPVEGTIADFGNNKVELDENGFTVTPDYEGVDSGQPDQNKEKDGCGSFPKSWVDFNVLTGQAQYWYTSGGAADARKNPSPLSVSFTGTPVMPEQPPATPQPPAPSPKPDTGDDNTEKPDGTSTEEKNPPETPTGSDATLFWAINKETSAGGFAPGTCNFLSAGVSPDNGGAVVWDAPGKLYKPTDGNVKIEKPDASGEFHTATWQNKCDDRYGGRVVAADKDSHHESRLNIAGGSINIDDGEITASWDGGFTIVFYSGMTYWSVSDPKLTVTKDGRGELTGTASGYGADMEDLSKWEKLKSETITLATFSGLDVNKAVKDGGFTVTPDYLGVDYRAGDGNTPQDRTEAEWGSFPKSWVDFNVKTGQSSYWYSSGGIADARKPALPLTIAFDNSFQVPATEPAKPGESVAGAGGPGSTVTGGNTVGGPGVGGPGAVGPGGGPQSSSAQSADVEDKTAFAATAYEARRSEGMGTINAKAWWLGGATAATGIAATVGIGWLLRRNIGLDPSTWT